MFQGASNFSQGVDDVFMFIVGISTVFLVGLTFAMIWFAIRYNHKRNPKATQIKDNKFVELTWILIPLIIVLAMFYYGYVVYKPMRNAPEGAMVVKVTGQMWDWSFEYENGKVSYELYLPINKPVKLLLYSPDVIHSFYIPAFRIKEDMVPGKENYMWFIPTAEGSFDVLCAEYCGQRHSFMTTKAIIIPDEKFEVWLKEEPPVTVESLGIKVLRNNACISCHSLDGSKLVGPTFQNLYGESRQVIVDGQEITMVADSAYIYNSIIDPDKELVKGYGRGVMRSYKNVIPHEDIVDLINYFKSLKEEE
ncbi:MAG: cytochrome c oxidase subunit II [Bacteroidetes bacterium HGW-Bacteroidetes-15]|nr:MAG: cytochrome c oxidase subunit II [Bacteroidetes bacterium HGW-Bacteroidetes-15]